MLQGSIIGFPFIGYYGLGSRVCYMVCRKGSMCPGSIKFGLKVVPIWVLRGQSIYYLGALRQDCGEAMQVRCTSL